ncbi:MAG: Spy/CpxP family protein refolding chaperone [Phycisphaerae bacterium]|jgi:Spy/CpxP family protein refolding chaperone
MNRFCWISGLTVLCASIAWAQENPPPDDDAGAASDKPVTQARGVSSRTDYSALADRLTQELSLTDEQRRQLEQFIAEERAGQRKVNAHGADAHRMQEMRKALKEGDTKKAEELRKQMGERRGAGALDRILDKLDPTLNDEQRAKLADIRPSLAGAAGMSGGTTTERLGRLKTQLELDEKQSAEFDRLYEQFQKNYAGLEEQQQAEMMGLIDQVREAAKAGDNERVAQLREQIESSRGQTDEAVHGFLDEVEKILRDEQMFNFERYTRQFASKDNFGPAGDVRRLLAAARRLDLDREQRDKLRDLERETSRAARQARRDSAAAAQVYESAREKLAEIIGADKVSELEQKLSEHGALSRRGARKPQPPESENPPAEAQPENP